MKAVLCLWAREHLKGRLGPGSGLARLLKKKKTQHSPLYVRVCVCVWQRAAKQDGGARLLLAETLRGTDRVVDAEERRGMKEWFHWRRGAADLFLPVMLLQVCPAGLAVRGAALPCGSPEER